MYNFIQDLVDNLKWKICLQQKVVLSYQYDHFNQVNVETITKYCTLTTEREQMTLE